MSDINGSKPTNFPLDESKLSFKIPRDEHPRENLLKLGSMITNRIGLKATADDPEYWGLASVMTDEMVEVALKMPALEIFIRLMWFHFCLSRYSSCRSCWARR